jgi:hypothetical protein
MWECQLSSCRYTVYSEVSFLFKHKPSVKAKPGGENDPQKIFGVGNSYD